jgi:alkanesulfonate monooxygenase SsuD/methylene tetrahydromethanopterin reductase-like flavin-dependent oxidoreductase (luciferase family)
MLLTVVPDANASADQLPAELSQRMVVGSPESIAEQIKTKVLDAGVSGVIFNIPAYRPGVIAETGAALRAVLDA